MVAFLISDEGKARAEGDRRALHRHRRGDPAVAHRVRAAGGGDVLRGAGVRHEPSCCGTAPDGRGLVSVLELPAVQDKPQLFSTFLMWLLADLFQDLPEVGDLDRPKLVFFFDEAHLLFNGASKAFLESITQTVRLIRSKGVGHLLRDADAEGRARRRARPARQPGPARAAGLHPGRREGAEGDGDDVPRTPPYDLEEVLTAARHGEAVVTVLSENGAPTPVAATRLRAPQSLMGPVTGGGARRGGQGLAAVRAVRAGGRPRVGVREAGGGGRPPGAARGRGGRDRPPGPPRGRAEGGRKAAANRPRRMLVVEQVVRQRHVQVAGPLRGYAARAGDHPVAVRHGPQATLMACLPGA